MWQARYKDPTNPGQRIERTFRTKAEGERWLTQPAHGILTGTHVDPRKAERPFRR